MFKAQCHHHKVAEDPFDTPRSARTAFLMWTHRVGHNWLTSVGVVLQRFWFIPLDDSIRELMSDPAFVKALQSPRLIRVGTFWASREYRRLNKVLGGVLDNLQHGVLEIGFDFAEPYNFAKHSTGLMFMR